MNLQNGTAKDGNRLSDLFKFLSDVEYHPALVDVIKSGDAAKIDAMLAPYNIPDALKRLLRDHAAGNNLEQIKQACAAEIDRIRDILGIC